MKKISLLLAIVAVSFLSFKALAPTNWKVDPVHSNLGFAVVHLGVSEIKGTVKITKATIKGTEEGFAGAEITLEADMNTIYTGDEKRDGHLKTADFFDAAKFPTSSFASTSLTKVGDDKYELKGNLTMHGITKPVTLTAVIKSATNPMSGKPVTGCKVTGMIKRSDFDIATTTPVGILSDEVMLDANTEFAVEQ